MCVVLVKSLQSFKCVWFDVFVRPISRKNGRTKTRNDFNEVNLIVFSFGAVFMSCFVRGVGSAPQLDSDCAKQRCSAFAGCQPHGVLGQGDRCAQRGFEVWQLRADGCASKTVLLAQLSFAVVAEHLTCHLPSDCRTHASVTVRASHARL